MSISSNSTFSNLLRQDVLFVSRNPMRALVSSEIHLSPCNAYSNLIEAKTNLSALPQVSDIISIGYMESCHGNYLISFLTQILDVTRKLRRGFESVGGSTWNICLSRTRSMDRVPRGTSGGRNRTAECIHAMGAGSEDCSTWNRMWPKMLCASPCVRGALCSMWNNVEPDRYKICTRIFLFHVKQLAPQLGLC